LAGRIISSVVGVLARLLPNFNRIIFEGKLKIDTIPNHSLLTCTTSTPAAVKNPLMFVKVGLLLSELPKESLTNLFPPASATNPNQLLPSLASLISNEADEPVIAPRSSLPKVFAQPAEYYLISRKRKISWATVTNHSSKKSLLVYKLIYSYLQRYQHFDSESLKLHTSKITTVPTPLL